MYISEQFILELTNVEKKVLLRKTAVIASKFAARIANMRRLFFLSTALKALGKSLKAVGAKQKALDDKIMKKLRLRQERRIKQKIINIKKELDKERHKLQNY